MKGRTKPKGFGIAAAGLLAALLIAAAILPAMSVAETKDGDIGIKSCQKIDITAQKVKLYVDPDGPGDNTGELYAEYTTDCGDFDVKTGVISVPQNTEQSFTVPPYAWTNLKYCADTLHVLVWDQDVAFDDKLFDEQKSVSSGVYVWSNSNVKLTTYVNVHW
ncbi:MAG: hypothetical protein U9N36_02595 [Euryarchaeota archaeon]|nr:hypothetical protein [Euryarchaeota archaeon]